MKTKVTSLRPVPQFRAPDLADFAALRVEKYYRERVRDTWAGGHIMRGRQPGTDALQLCSNDYLALAKHPHILRAMSESIQRDGNGLLMSGIFVHGACPHTDFEQRLAEFMQAEAGVLCQSGYSANTGLIQVIASEQTPVYADMMAHMSLWEGIRLAGAKPITVFHNEVEHLERQILRHGPGVVVVDSIYSTTGSIAPLSKIVEICEAQGCILVADESHSLGTHGPNGEGLVVELGLAERVHFRTASLAKAFAGRAGFVTCSRRFAEYFKSESNPAIFSSTLLPHDIRGLAATLGVVRQEGWRRDRLRANAAYLRTELDALGYNLNDSECQIVSLESGSEQNTIALRDALESRGIFGAIFCAPATPKSRSLMRFSVHAALTDDELARIVAVCGEIRDELGVASWASTRRKLRGKAANAGVVEAGHAPPQVAAA
ncbi:alpha-hydroxyketone-type quorum-sensing autoinducer synthase [Sulfuritalea sp.]|jgi:CAI-1 autoinducer synthase|uniref:alpha-hydroxyketone-type quorum-sensing autoinducer synthase n=1 Tax=Sulfuritalea sp. TaxID=2480090 RepID=UPI001AC3D4AE|nr:alpha-hydroxyketone-type quorum-sensing autoinducer synthase [Sulfuritalea sp.]MBN8475353.1 quorum-sensing autoinducer CAI-1 synthase [Sulfuritalea sp.]